MPQHQITLTSFTGRVKLVPPSVADDEPFAALRSHPTTRLNLQFFPEHTTAEEMRARREAAAENAQVLQFSLYLQKEDGTTSFAGALGLLNIDPLNDSCSVGVVISPDHHRSGLATEALYLLLKFAFEEKKIHRATFDTAVDNVKMKGWLENIAGVEQEFRLKDSLKIGPGTYIDSVGYGILDRDWTGEVKARLEERINRKRNN